jgi:tetratricopeptide (TPR) repeat protein
MISGGAIVRPIASITHDETQRDDDALAVSALRDRVEGGIQQGGMAVGITVRAGQLRDHGAAHIAQGDRCTAQGDRAAALQHYGQAAALMERLSAADPANPAFSRDLSVAQNRIAAVLFAQGHLREAADGYRRSIAVMEQLARTNPHNADFQNDLAWCRARLAEVSAASGNGGMLSEEPIVVRDNRDRSGI